MTSIKPRKWCWIGYTCSRESNNIARQTLDYYPQGKRKAQEQLEAVHAAGREGVGYVWERAKTVAKNRVRWRILVDALWGGGGGAKGILMMNF